MEQKIFVGVDPSWTCTALVALQVIDGKVAHLATELIKTKAKDWTCQMRRLDYLCVKFADALQEMEPDHVAIEGYSYGSPHNAVMLGELGGCLRRSLWSRGHGYFEVPPTTLKSWVCPKGHAKKEEMRLHCYKRWQFEAATNDEVDAYCLARMAIEMHVKKTKVVEVLRRKCKWVESVERNRKWAEKYDREHEWVKGKV